MTQPSFGAGLSCPWGCLVTGVQWWVAEITASPSRLLAPGTGSPREKPPAPYRRWSVSSALRPATGCTWGSSRKRRKLSRWVWLGSCLSIYSGGGGTQSHLDEGPYGAGGTAQRGGAGPANTVVHTSVMSVPGPQFPLCKGHTHLTSPCLVSGDGDHARGWQPGPSQWLAWK